MTAPNPADVELVAAAIWSSDWPDGQDWATTGATEPEYRANAVAVLAALEAAGRLVPAGSCAAPVGAHQHSESCRVPVPTTPGEQERS